MDCFSNPSLQFLIERLVDQNNTPLPVLKAILSISTVVEISKTEELTSLETNRWSLYLKNTNNVQEAIEKSLPLLLQHFVANFQQANNTDQKPTFYIIYDSSWWRSLE